MIGNVSPSGRRYQGLKFASSDVPWDELTRGRGSYCCIVWDTEEEFQHFMKVIEGNCSHPRIIEMGREKRSQGWVTIGRSGDYYGCPKTDAFRTYTDEGPTPPFRFHKVNEFLNLIRENRK